MQRALATVSGQSDKGPWVEPDPLLAQNRSPPAASGHHYKLRAHNFTLHSAPTRRRSRLLLNRGNPFAATAKCSAASSLRLYNERAEGRLLVIQQ